MEWTGVSQLNFIIREMAEEKLHQAEEPDCKKDVLWKCCSGGYADSRLLAYIVQVIFSFVALLFCMFKLSSPSAGEDVTVWVSLISAIVGNFMPSAVIKDNSNSNN